jgi:hypothetical protein
VVAAGGRPQRHRAAISSHVSRSGDKKNGAVRSAISTGTHRR